MVRVSTYADLRGCGSYVKTDLFLVELNFRLMKGHFQNRIYKYPWSLLESFIVMIFFAFNASSGGGRDKTSSNGANTVEVCG